MRRLRKMEVHSTSYFIIDVYSQKKTIHDKIIKFCADFMGYTVYINVGHYNANLLRLMMILFPNQLSRSSISGRLMQVMAVAQFYPGAHQSKTDLHMKKHFIISRNTKAMSIIFVR